MRKNKIIFKVDSNLHGFVYANKKWYRKDVFRVETYGEPGYYTLEIEMFKRSKEGHLVIENNELATETKRFRFERSKHERH